MASAPRGADATVPATEVWGHGPHRVVFVHGVMDRGRAIAPVAELLAGECHIEAYDRRGYGDSAGLPGCPAGIDAHIDDVVAVLDGRPAVLVGHSFGGLHALGAAVRAPELVRAVVCYESVPAWTPGWPDTAMRSVFASDDPAGTALTVLLGTRFTDADPAEQQRWRARTDPFLTEERSIRTGAPPYELSAVRAPVFYGTGANEQIGITIEYLRSQVPEFELVTFPGADHFAHRSAPREFADLIRRAL